MQEKNNKWILPALFLALALIVQSLRFFIPMIPGPVSMFLIGSLENAIMICSIWYSKSLWAVLIGILLPIGAFLQGQLAILPMLPVVALGNVCLILGAWAFPKRVLLYLVPFLKAAVLYGGTYTIVQFLALPGHVVKIMLFIMSWPQVITGLIGIILAKSITWRIKPFI